MTLREATDWLKKHGGTFTRVQVSADHAYYQARVGPRHSTITGIPHNGHPNIPDSDPELQRIFVKLVDEVRRIVERSGG